MRKTLTVFVTTVALMAGMVAVPWGASASVVTDYSECANGAPPSTATNCVSWLNGTLQASNSHYSEDQIVPQRLVLSFGDTNPHTVTFAYQTNQSGVHAYDYLATWNLTQFTADPCQSLTTAWCSGASTTFPMVSDPNSVPNSGPGISQVVSTHELAQADRQWTAFGGAVTNSSAITYNSVNALVTITVHASSTSSPVVVLFGGHLAAGGTLAQNPRAWGTGLGASSVPGGPYQIKIDNIDGGGGGASNNIQANGLVTGSPLFTITKTASTTSTTAGGQVIYTIKVTNTGTAPGSVTFVDNYDDRVSATTPVSTPSGGTCVAGNNSGDLFWTCGTIQLAAGGGSQTFTYMGTMPTSLTSGDAGTGGCPAGTFPVKNTATLTTGGTPGTVTVCVTAAAQFTIVKTADESTVNPGGTIHYHVTVTNTGSATGSTTFTDDFDDRLSMSAVTTTPTGGTCNNVSGTLQCTTSQIDPTHTQVFDYSGQVPLTFSGDPGTGCTPGQFAIKNSASLTSVSTGSSGTTVCVNAVPSFTISKSATPSPTTPGTTIHYTVTVTNGGAAAGSTTFKDVYDSRLSPSAVAVTGGQTAGSCTNDSVNHTLNCTTGTINGGNDQQVFKYDATLPASFDGPLGTGCAPGQFAVTNTATLANNTPASATVCVTAAPQFTVTKSVSSASVAAGGSVTYTLDVQNIGNASGSTTITDDFDDRLSPSVPAGCSVITPGGNKELQCTTGSILAGSDQKFIYTATMPSTFDGGNGTGGCPTGSYPVINSVVVTDGGAHDSKTVCVTASPTFTISKSASPANPVGPNALITYVVTVSNTGSASGSTMFTDDYDSRLNPSSPTSNPTGAGCTNDTVNTAFNCTTSLILAGHSQTFTYTANMPGTFTSPGTGCPTGQYAVTNSANINGSQGAPATATVCVTASPLFTITKTADPLDANPGQQVTYTITVTNSGTASGSTTFTDDYDNRLDGSITAPAGCSKVSGTLHCTTGTISADPPNNTQTFTYKANMPSTFGILSPTAGCSPPRGKYSVTNTATLTGANSGTPGSGTVVICVNATPTFTISKSASSDSVDAGKPVTYTIVVTNGGTAAGSTSFTDDYDDRLNVTPPAGCTLGTTGTPPNVNKVMNCVTGTISADPPNNTQTFSYTVNMPSTFSGNPGGSGCSASQPEQFPISNTATLANGMSDPVTVCVNAAPHFTVIKSAPKTASAGDPVTYTITVTNDGTAAGSTTFTDDYDDRLNVTPPSGCALDTTGTAPNLNKVMNCTTGTISADPPNNTQVFTYTVTLPATFNGPSGSATCPTGTYPIDNVVTLANGNNAPAEICVTATPKFTIVKSVAPATVGVNGTVTYTVVITNTGTASGSTTFQDNYDDRITPSDVTTDPTGGTCTPGVINTSDKVLNCTTGTINAGTPGNTQTFTYTATVPGSFTGPSGGSGCDTGSFPITNTATLTSISTGSDPATVCVTAAPKFTVTKTVDSPTAVPDQTVHYTVVVTNTGTAPGVGTFQDNYDDRLTPVNLTTTPAGGSCQPGTIGSGDKVLNCTSSSLDPGASQTFKYDAQIPDAFTGDPGTGCGPGQFAIHNSVTLTTVNTGSDGSTVCVNAVPAFTITKTVSPASVDAGLPVTYTIHVTNGGHASGSTTFTDVYDSRISPPTPAGCTNDTANHTFTCTTGVILAGNSQDFMYTVAMPATFTGSPGGGNCSIASPQQYAVINTATLANGLHDSATVCVNAAPAFTVNKVANPTVIDAGGTVTYTITVTNGGTASGSTSFVDDFDDRLSPSAVTISPNNGGTCSVSVDPNTGNKTLGCSTGIINANAAQTFTYTAQMPNTFSGIPGGANCSANDPQRYPVTNSVVLANGNNKAATVCVNAAPVPQLVKSVVKTVDTSGNEFLVYTIAYKNVGHADSMATLITDAIPSGTTYASCTGGCSTTGAPVVQSVSWNIGPLPALTGSGSVTLTVMVSATAVCTISNTAFIQFDANAPFASNTASIVIDPLPNPAGAHASGNAIGVQVKTSGIVGINLGPIGQASTVRNGLGPTQTANKTVLGISLPANGSLVRVPVVNETSASAVSASPPFAQDVTSAAVDHVCLLPIGNVCTVQADTVQAVASTLATGAWATYSSGGSTIQNLKILGVGTVVNLNQTTKINLNALIFGAGSYVAINERTGSAGLVGSTYVADAQVTMIHLVVTGLLNLQSANVIVSQATSHADFPQTLVCGNVAHQSVSGHAFVAQLLNDPTIADTTVGYVAIPPTGANESQQIVGVNLPANDSVIGAAVAASRSFSNMNSTTSYAESSAEIGGNNGPMACVLRVSATSCLVTLQLVHSQSQSTATAKGAISTDAGTQLLAVSILGTPLALSLPPNTPIIIPGMGYIVLNEQFCDGGGLTYTHTCTGTHHSGLTVRALDIVFTFLGSGLGVVPATQLIVAEAHSDATFGA